MRRLRKCRLVAKAFTWQWLAARGPGRTKTLRRFDMETRRSAVEAFFSRFQQERPPRCELVFPHAYPSPVTRHPLRHGLKTRATTRHGQSVETSAPFSR